MLLGWWSCKPAPWESCIGVIGILLGIVYWGSIGIMEKKMESTRIIGVIGIEEWAGQSALVQHQGFS